MYLSLYVIKNFILWLYLKSNLFLYREGRVALKIVVKEYFFGDFFDSLFFFKISEFFFLLS